MNAFAQWFTSLIDAISQFLSTAPLWIQAPLVMIVVIPLCAVVAMIWLRFIDFCGALITRSKRPRTRSVERTSEIPPAQNRQRRVITGEFDQKAGRDG